MKNQLVLTVKRDFANISARFHKTAGGAHNRRWLTDNFYLMEKQAKMICQNCKKQELRRFSVDEKGEFALLSLLSRYLDQVQNQVTEETLLTFTEENAKALTRSELWALPMALSAQILHRIAALPENLEGLAPLVKSLYAASDIDWADAYLAVSPLEKILSQDETYRQMDFDSKQLYQLEIAEMAQKSGRSEAEIAQEAILEAGKARVGVEYFILGPGSARFGAKKKKGSLFWYLAAVFAISHALSFLCFLATGSFWGYLLSHFLTWEVAITLVNTVLQRVAKPKILPRLALLEGISDAAKTLVVVPALLSSEKRPRNFAGSWKPCILPTGKKTFILPFWGISKRPAKLPFRRMKSFVVRPKTRLRR